MHPYLTAYAMGTGCLLIPRNCSHSPFTFSLKVSQSCANLELLQVIEYQISQNKVDINSNWDRAVVVIEDKISAVSLQCFQNIMKGLLPVYESTCMIQYIHSFHVLVVHGLGSYLVLPSLLLWLTVPIGIPVVNGCTFFGLQAELLSQGSVFCTEILQEW